MTLNFLVDIMYLILHVVRKLNAHRELQWKKDD